MMIKRVPLVRTRKEKQICMNKAPLKRLFSCRFSFQRQEQRNVVGMRREDKNCWERRAPLSPQNVKTLVKDYGMKVYVQPSHIRAFSDKEYEECGAIIEEDLSRVNTILALKEVPKDLLIPEKTYTFFSHTIKAQPQNMGMLDTILKQKIRLIDYERIIDDIGQRLVKFGPFAGMAGAIDVLHTVGERLLTYHGYSTPFVNIGFARNYANLDVAKESVKTAGDLIATYGLPRNLFPFVITITGTGAVSSGVKSILESLPCKFVTADELPQLWEKDKPSADEYNRTIYVCVTSVKDMVRHSSGYGRGIDVKHYYQHPEEYEPIFHEKVLPYTRVLFNAIYWEPRFPKLITTDQARKLIKEEKFNLISIGDITCDINGSIDFLVKATTISEPNFVYDIMHGKIVSKELYSSSSSQVAVLGVDNWPSAFSRSASEYFGNKFVSMVPYITRCNYNPKHFDSNDSDPFQLNEFPHYIRRAVITSHGKLTPSYQYINELRRKRKETLEKSEKYRKKVLLLGSGMVVPPIVEYLSRFSIVKQLTIGGIDLKRTNELVKQYAPSPEIPTEYHQDPSKPHKIRFRTSGGRESTLESVYIDVADESKENLEELDDLIQSHDLVLSLVPAPLHPTVAKYCIKHKKDMITASYISPEMKKLDEEAKKAGIMILNEIGLDPGIDHMCVMQTLEKIRAENGKLVGFQSYCGALPAPEHSNNPLGYKFSWSPRGVLTAAQNEAFFKLNNQEFQIPGNMLMFSAQSPTKIARFAHPAFSFEMIPNRNSLQYIDYYGLQKDDLKIMLRGTLRYPGFCKMFKCFKLLGLLESNLEVSLEKVKNWLDLMKIYIVDDHNISNEQDLEKAILKKIIHQLGKQYTIISSSESLKKVIPSNSKTLIDHEAREVVDGMKQLGMLSAKTSISLSAAKKQASILDVMCSLLENKLAYGEKERDFIYMHHEFHVHYESREDIITATLCVHGDEEFSATAKTVGLPVAISSILALDGDLQGMKGVCGPTEPVLYNKVLKELQNEGINILEQKMTSQKV